MAVDVGISLLDVVAVLLDGVAHSTNVVVGMVAYLMAFVNDTLIKFRVFAYIVTYHEKGGFDIFLLEYIKNEGRSLGNWAVVERQIDCVFVTVHSP